MCCHLNFQDPNSATIKALILTIRDFELNWYQNTATHRTSLWVGFSEISDPAATRNKDLVKDSHRNFPDLGLRMYYPVFIIFFLQLPCDIWGTHSAYTLYFL